MGRRQGLQFIDQRAIFIEQIFRPVALHPLFEQLEVPRFGRQFGKRHLVRTPIAFGFQAIDLLRTGPALRRSQNDHRPHRSLGDTVAAGLLPNGFDVGKCGIHGRRHQLVHRSRIGAFNKIGLVAVADEQTLQLLMAHPGQDRWIGDLVEPFSCKIGSTAPSLAGLRNLLECQAAGQGSGLGFTFADHAAGASGRLPVCPSPTHPLKRYSPSEHSFPANPGIAPISCTIFEVYTGMVLLPVGK